MHQSSLLRLTPEILVSIAQQLCTHCTLGGLKNVDNNVRHQCLQRTALSHLSRTCRQLRDVVQPILFHVVVSNDHLLQLVNTLIQRPALAESIKQLQLTESSPGEAVGAYQMDSDDSIVRTAEKIGMIFKANASTKEDYMDALGPILQIAVLHLTTNLEYLSLDTAYSSEFKHSPIAKGLPLLHNIEARHGDSEMGFDMSNLEAIFKSAPNLKQFNGTMMSHVWQIEGTVYNNSVTKVQLIQCVLDNRALPNLMRAFPKLEVFHYSAAHSPGPHNDIGLHNISEGLLVRRDTLKDVAIDLSEVIEQDLLVDDYEGLKSLREMNVLERLFLESKLICPLRISSDSEEEDQDEDEDGDEDEDEEYRRNRLVKLLPRSIRVFTLANPRPELDENILQFAQAATAKFPSLEKVRLWNVDEERASLFTATFASHGVNFTVDEVSEFDPDWPDYS